MPIIIPPVLHILLQSRDGTRIPFILCLFTAFLTGCPVSCRLSVG